ncbi:hypothetical protein QZH41_014061 [Actinostola sp. cb2023]|nr:hypothetical protein QZH41_014061 [Actinostola sp. cb2023]
MNSDEIELLSDSKYRQFINAVDKALKNFEYSSEWADLISALGKLNKVLLLHLKFKVVPRKIIIAKRLSQCMHPALPSGVHLKALETYELIFRRLGNKGLAQDLFIYSSGLFPLLGNAAMSVKPALMSIYEEFYVSLGRALIPCLPGLLLGLLPGIEEGSEYTNRTISILESISHKTDMVTFYSTLWYCILTTTSVRLPAITFIMTRLNKKTALKQDYILGNDIPMMVQAVCIALSDPYVLVQRSLLDFLLTFLPMNCNLVSAKQKVKLVAAGLSSLLRRDMSLNRRLYTWLLGPEESKPLSRADSASSVEDEDHLRETYFNVYSKSTTVEALRELFRNHYTSTSSSVSSNSKKPLKNEALLPFRILISLLDRPEIGSTVLEDVLIEVFRVLYFRCRSLKSKSTRTNELDRKDSDEGVLSDEENSTDPSSKSKVSDDLIKTANLLFNAFEPYFMWDYVCKLLSVSFVEQQQGGKESTNNDESSEKQISREDSKIPSTSFSEVLHLTDFLLDVVALEADVETQTDHWPRLLCHVTMEMTSRCQSLSLVEIGEGISLCSKLLSKVMPSMKIVEKSHKADSVSMTSSYVSDSEKDNLNAKNSEHRLHNGPMSHFTESFPSERKSVNSNDSNTKDELTDTSDSPARKVSRGRVIHVARISAGADGWSVVDLRKRLETEVNGDVADQQSYDEDSELTESGEGDVNETEDSGSANENQNYSEKTQNEKTDSEMKENQSEIEKEDEREEYDEWSECDDRGYDVTKTVLKSASGFSTESTESTSPNMTANLFQPSLIQSCVHYFQSFFSAFVNQRIIASNSSSYYENSGSSNRRNSEIILQEILSKDSSNEKHTTNSGLTDVISERGLDVLLPWEQESSLLCAEAFAAACKLLVELSCFPVYCTNDFIYSDPNHTDGETKRRLPEWLQALIVCCFRVQDFDVQSSAVGTLLDLVNLTLSVAPTFGSDRPKLTVVVVVIPMISHVNLNVIEKSCIYKESRLDNHWKFAIFWHAARNVVIQDSGRTSRLGDPRPLDRALFIMLDGLESDDPEIRVLTKQWLAHALQHDDLGRLLDPLLVLLLHPATARLSVHHACAIEQKSKSADQSITQAAIGRLRLIVEVIWTTYVA